VILKKNAHFHTALLLIVVVTMIAYYCLLFDIFTVVILVLYLFNCFK
jgi:hypothetical protein